jgi:hypothetical protein
MLGGGIELGRSMDLIRSQKSHQGLAERRLTAARGAASSGGVDHVEPQAVAPERRVWDRMARRTVVLKCLAGLSADVIVLSGWGDPRKGHPHDRK